LLKNQPNLNVVEMDVVEGVKGGKVFLTMMFRNCSLMLIFLLESKTQHEVERVFNEMMFFLGVEEFKKLFPVILTDGGSEFQNPYALESSIYSGKRTSIYYCDPYSSWQKGMLEKNHEYIRLVLPKGTSFNDLDHQDVMLLQDNINSEARDSLNGCSPFKLSQLLLDKNLHQALNLKEIAPDDVFLKPELLKK
jgi:IS30 family transposase